METLQKNTNSPQIHLEAVSSTKNDPFLNNIKSDQVFYMQNRLQPLTPKHDKLATRNLPSLKSVPRKTENRFHDTSALGSTSAILWRPNQAHPVLSDFPHLQQHLKIGLTASQLQKQLLPAPKSLHVLDSSEEKSTSKQFKKPTDNNLATSYSQRLYELSAGVVSSDRAKHPPMTPSTRSLIEKNKELISSAIAKEKSKPFKEYMSKMATKVSFFKTDRSANRDYGASLRGGGFDGRQEGQLEGVKQAVQKRIFEKDRASPSSKIAPFEMEAKNMESSKYPKEASHNQTQGSGSNGGNILITASSERTLQSNKDGIEVKSSSKPMNFNYHSVMNSFDQNSAHPQSMLELYALFESKSWPSPSTDAFNIADFTSLSYKDKATIFENSFGVYKAKSQEKLFENSAHLTTERLSKLFIGINSDQSKIRLAKLVQWFSTQLANLKLPGESTHDKYFQSKVMYINYFITMLSEELKPVRKDFGEALTLLNEVFRGLVEEINGYVKSFANRMESKWTSDFNFIESRYKDDLRIQRSVAQSTTERLTDKLKEVDLLKKNVHMMKSKLSSDYLIISDLRKEIEFGREYARIIDTENDKLTSQLALITEELKSSFTKNPAIKLAVDSILNIHQLSVQQQDELRERWHFHNEADLTSKQKFELMKILEDDSGKYDEFRTHSKLCGTEDFVKENQVSVQFAPAHRKPEMASKKVQITMSKPVIKDMTTQTLADASRRRVFGSEDDEGSIFDSSRQRYIAEKINIIGVQGGEEKPKLARHLSLFRQNSIIQEPPPVVRAETSPNAAKLSRQPSLSITNNQSGFLALPIPEMDGAPRHSRQKQSKVSFSKNTNFKEVETPRRSEDNNSVSMSHDSRQRIFMNTRNSVDKEVESVKSSRKNSFLMGSPNRSETVAERKPRFSKLVQQRTAFDLKADISSEECIEEGSREGPTSTHEFECQEGYEQMRENQLKAELTRQKQQLTTMAKRLLGSQGDQKKSAEIQAMIDLKSSEIEKLEQQLAGLKSRVDVVEKLKQFKAPAPISPMKNSKGSDLAIIKAVQRRNNYIITMASRILQSVLKTETIVPSSKKKDIGLVKQVSKFYWEYVQAFERNISKGNLTFPTMPLKFNMYKTLSHYNSSDKIVDKKYRAILLSLKGGATDLPYLEIFAGFLGIGKLEFDHYTFETYVKLLLHLRNKLKIDSIKRYTTKLDVPWRDMEALLDYYLDCLSKTKREGNERKTPLHKLLENHCFQANAIMKVDLDWCLLQILRFDAKSALNFPKQFYLAADTNGDGSIDLEEFTRLARYIEPTFYKINRLVIKAIFEQYAITSEDSPELILTPTCFEKLCQDKQIFNQKAFENFFSHGYLKGPAENIEDLVRKWEDIKFILKYILSILNHEGLGQLLLKVDNMILQLNSESDRNKLWLNYKLLELDVNRLHAESLITEILPPQLIATEQCIYQMKT